MVLLAALTTAVLLVLAASRAAATFRDVPASVPERRPVPALVTAAHAANAGVGPTALRRAASGYVVQPGDTLWSIARRLQPDGDVRPLVDQLVDLNGGTDLAVGQRLPIP